MLEQGRPKPEVTKASSDEPADEPADEEALLLQFVQERDVPCPLCGYNLRNLVKTVCPECSKHLALTVGVQRPQMGWFIATIAPGIFSGISAAFMLALMLAESARTGGGAPFLLWAVDLFGWASGIMSLVLVKKRFRFLRQSDPAQRMWAIVMWFVHVAAFLTLLNVVL